MKLLNLLKFATIREITMEFCAIYDNIALALFD